MADDRTHTLLAGDYARALGGVVAETLPRVQDAYVLLDHDELDARFEPAASSRERWSAVRDSFEPVDGPGPFPEEAVDVQTGERVTDRDTHTGCTAFRLDGDPAGVERLCSLASEPVVGQWFLQQIRLIDGEEVALSAVPHHRDLWVDADAFGGRDIDSVADALADCRGCLVPTGTRLEWSVNTRTYRLTGGSMCIEPEGGPPGHTCWRLTRLDSVRRDGSELLLTWESDERPLLTRTVNRALSAVLPGVSLPDRVPCKDSETAESARGLIAETLAAYEPE